MLDFDVPKYSPPVGLGGGHRQTVVPSVFREVTGVRYRRQRLELDDGDFLDLDLVPASGGSWKAAASGARGAGRASDRVVLISHGLEGTSERAYVRGMAKAFASRGWDAVAWNHRGCSGEPNRLARAYHSGTTEDLAAVVDWALARGYAHLGLVGFSLGGNVTLKYVGDAAEAIAPEIVGAVGISVPVDLAGSAETMKALDRRLYMKRFIGSLASKAEEKALRFEDAPDPEPIRAMTSFAEFDAHVTAPLHGFESAEDYWAQSSALPVLERVAVPTLLLNARNDPFLAPSCFPEDLANPLVRLIAPEEGGHVGWPQRPLAGELWDETVAARWLEAAYAASSASKSAAPSSTA